ncbi:MAG TPA: hypothetical protein VH114_02715 [Candidatus Acidoferrum sp.]|jgi:hypothetical protein|nr:hypothetical protein [Candidatus Acidoferrum sp.]
MKPIIHKNKFGFLLAASLAICLSAGAQQAKQADLRQLQSYDAGREVQVVGTIVKFDSASSVLPMGTHVLMQTASGQVDVHLGNARVLAANHLALNAGDNIRIVGEPMALGDGTYFAARIVQKGMQAVAVRNTKGFLLTPASTLSQTEKEALRGVR